MKASKPKPKACNTCGSRTEMYMCSPCAAELRHMLVGVKGGQPGIVWYISRLFEQAYGQSRLGAIDSAHHSDDGYALLVDQRCTNLLAQIRGVLGDWVANCDGLAATWADETGTVGVRHRAGHVLPLESRYATFLACHLKTVRRSPDSGKLFSELARLNHEANRIINRPADVCCGPCAHELKDGNECGTMLYAEENASYVTCPRCRTQYNVLELRNAMREKVKGMLFTGAELRRLMETRLNDRIPKATFYKLIADGRLTPSGFKRMGDKMIPLFTYGDVVAARAKPVPAKHKSNTRKMSSDAQS